MLPRHSKRRAKDETGSPLASPLASESQLPLRREVLVAEDDLSISNLLFLLLEELTYDSEEALYGRDALATLDREDFDAILLDIRCPDLPLVQSPPRVTQIEPSMVGRVLVITMEADHADVLELIERHCVLRVPRSHRMDDLHRWLERLRGPSSLRPPH